MKASCSSVMTGRTLDEKEKNDYVKTTLHKKYIIIIAKADEAKT